MLRTFVRSTVAAAALSVAGFALAQEGPALANDEPEKLPQVEADTTVDASSPAPASAPAEGCPDGSCYQGYDGKYGHYGHHAKARARAGYYPNGIDNYSDSVRVGAYGGAGGCRTCSGGQCQYRFYGQPDLFYNYYAWPSCTGWGAELYVSPLPVPPHVGHTYITYQPLMPHEFLYQHHRTYHRYYNSGQGLTRTSVIWFAPLFRK